MTEKTCCVSTPERRKSVEIRDATERPMLDKVFKAVDVAVTEVADGFREVGLEFDPTSGVIFYVHGSAGDIRPPAAIPNSASGLSTMASISSTPTGEAAEDPSRTPACREHPSQRNISEKRLFAIQEDRKDAMQSFFRPKATAV
ncbi:hypothetical protein SRABI05_03678 [Agrobacterium fabrum]|uniref:hypothetical protein n=1 Tax=Agrobacterium fabrum TaxID=1176649 RepID=UPI001D2B1CCD|nr:hypothetical protein [Agrobacterium fabrum]CAH0272681.1 hypothetical protein SRABI46_03794 [Agrobacterium fabrum]CAH0277072.1 hypothetical protein SRABI05_03678 [Agrobacterium fabrum]